MTIRSRRFQARCRVAEQAHSTPRAPRRPCTPTAWGDHPNSAGQSQNPQSTRYHHGDFAPGPGTSEAWLAWKHSMARSSWRTSNPRPHEAAAQRAQNTMLRLVHYRHSDKLFWSVSPCVRPSQPRPQRRSPQRHSIHFEDTGDTLYHTQPCLAYLYLIPQLEYLSIPSTTTEQQQCRITRPHCATVCHGSPPSCARAPMLRPSPTDTTHTSEFGAKVIREIRQQKKRGQEALCMAP